MKKLTLLIAICIAVASVSMPIAAQAKETKTISFDKNKEYVIYFSTDKDFYKLDYVKILDVMEFANKTFLYVQTDAINGNSTSYISTENIQMIFDINATKPIKLMKFPERPV